jgi:mercuric ion transport protein
MDNRTLLKTGIVGTVIAAVCCATPILVILLGALGLSAWAGWLDYVLMPALVIFVGVMIYALRRRRAEAARCDVGVGQNHKR